MKTLASLINVVSHRNQRVCMKPLQQGVGLSRYVGIVALVLPLAGCLPEGFIWWSPNGQTAAVRTEEGLRLTDAKGQLSPVVLPGQVQSAAWLPDGSSVVVCRSLKLTNWTAAASMLPRDEVERTMQMARGMPDLLKAGLTVSGGSMADLDKKFFEPLGVTEVETLEPALYCALSLYRQELRSAVLGFTNAAQLETEAFSEQTNGLSLYELTVLPVRQGQSVGEPRALVRSLRPLRDALVSPRYPVVAFRIGKGALKAITLDGKTSLEVADEDVASAAWSVDGRSLVHVVMKESDKLGEIRSRMVVSEGGQLMQGTAQVDTLALAAFAADSAPRLAVLPDGRILFASAPVTLPARAADIEPSARFFLLDPARPKTPPVAVIPHEGALPEDLSGFALSPDGRFVAVVESGTDAVAVLELATGKVKIISPAHPDWKSRMIPAWRNSHELTFGALPSPKATRPELIVWDGESPARSLSSNWPDSVVKAWLEAPNSENQSPAR